MSRIMPLVILIALTCSGVGLSSGDTGSQKQIKLGVLIDSRASYRDQGEATLRGVELALQHFNSEDASGLNGTLRIISTDEPWGTEIQKIVDAVYGMDPVDVLIGASDPQKAHLVAQVVTRAKGKVLFFTLCEDPSLTSIGIPWVYQLAPSGENPVQELTRREVFLLGPGSGRPTSGPVGEALPEEAVGLHAYEAARVALHLFNNGTTGDPTELKTTAFSGPSGWFGFTSSGRRVQLDRSAQAGLSGGH